MQIESRVLGKTGLSVSLLGFGAAEIGFNPISQKEVSTILNQALDSGLTLIDTASAYLESESLIGDSISQRRKEYTLVTKCGAIDGFSRSDWSKKGILATVEQSLKRLKTDYVDVLLLHSCSEEEMTNGEALQGVQAAKEKGYARHIGYSGDRSAALWAVKSDKFDVLETSLNIADQEAIDLTLPEAKKRNLGVIIKRPIANAAWKYKSTPETNYHVAYWKRLNELRYPFTSDASNAINTALRFTASHDTIHSMIVGTIKPERWHENSKVLASGPLSSGEYSAIRKRWKEVAKTDWVGLT